MPQLPKLKIKRKGRPIIKKDLYKLKLEDLKKAAAFKTPTGRSAAAKKLAGRDIATATTIGRMNQGKGNPAGKDLSLTGLIGGRKPTFKRLKPLPSRGPKRAPKRAPKIKMKHGGAAAAATGIAKVALQRARKIKPTGRINTDDIKRAMEKIPTGRSAAAKKVAMKGVKTKGGTLFGKLKTGKGNPAGKDKSFLGRQEEIGKLLRRLGVYKKRK